MSNSPRMRASLDGPRTRVPVAYAASVLPGRRPPRLCIVTTGRSGSNLLVDLLRNVPGVKADGELITTQMRSGVRFLDGRSVLAARRGASFYVTKVLGEQLRLAMPTGDGDAVVRRLHEDGWVLVHLHRRNLLAQAVSQERAITSGQWMKLKPGERGASFSIDPIRVMLLMGWTEAIDEAIAKSVEPLGAMRLCYEDDLLTPAAQQKTLDLLCDRLGLPRAVAATKHLKSSPRPLHEEVTNLPEIVDVLRRTRYAVHCDEESLG